jgi:OmpA-OmpF porin, OOP family
MKNIKALIISLLLSFRCIAQDADGCKEHPLFPTRMPNYILSECKQNFDAVTFNTAKGGSKTIGKEGSRTFLRYDFNGESGQQKPSTLQILRNYENASKKVGGSAVFLDAGEAIATYKIMKNGQEAAWVKIECGGNDNNDFFNLEILELEEMKQDITANDILTALNRDGHISLYINFDNGKWDIKPESQKTVDHVADMLKANPNLKVSIEGHTDNVGTPPANKTLSENRAKSVMNAVATKGIDKTRLAARGWGQEKPLGENTSEEGRAKNRRVEIVKL